ncbi:MAG: hypothetical protein K6E44_04955 [Bacteroidales bacterium]|nr:hypothetical protein [Bacteroidales bacterium]
MKKLFIIATLIFLAFPLYAQHLTIGGYGEAVFSRNFYSDNVYRYSRPAEYANDPSHGRFDIPHAVIYIGYDFGKGWSMQTEIEFEHTGTGSAVEKEFTEAGEWESEIEKGGELELEQFWIQKTFCPAFNIRAGHIVVPVGGLNYAHEPLNYFTVYRPEGEYTILPSTWHDTGISLWGQTPQWRYEVMVTAGLDGFMFDRDRFVHYGAKSPYEYRVANKLGYAARIDNFSIKGLRVGLSAFYGRAMHNSYPNDLHNTRYAGIKGRTFIGALDFAYKGKRLIVRGNGDFGYVEDAATISTIKRNLSSNNAPYKKTPVGQRAVAAGIEAGYDIAPWLNIKDSQLYPFARYEYYDSYIPASDQQDYTFTNKHRIAVGFNWFPIPAIAIKGEYSCRFMKTPYNNEPSISLGITYMAFFKR